MAEQKIPKKDKAGNWRLGNRIISKAEATRLLGKDVDATGIDCPDGYEAFLREPNCDAKGNKESKDKCKKSMWGKQVTYCKKQKTE